MARTNLAALAAAAPVYDGFYLRNSLGCTGTVPSPGPYDQCPDIIQSAQPLQDPQSMLSTPASWATAYDTQPLAGQTNYYYVRGLNGATTKTDTNVSLYATPAQLILFPQTWQNNRLFTASGNRSVAISAQPGAIGVGDDPFVLTPPVPAPGGFSSFIGHAHDESDTLPVVTTWLGMSQLLTQDLNFGFNNVTYVDADASSWYARIGLTIPQAITTSGQVMLMISSNGFSSGTVGLIGDLFTSNQQPILLNPFTLGTITSMTVTLDPGFSSTLTLEYWAGSGPTPASGSTISLSASYVIPPTEMSAAVTSGLVDGVRNRYLKDAGTLGVGPTATAFLGSATFVVS